MKFPRVKHFLCCISLRNGVLSMAYIGVVGDIISLLGILIMLATRGEVTYDDDYEEGLQEKWLKRNGAQEIPTLLVSIGLLGLLIYGVIKRRPGFFIPWMAMAGFAMIIFTVALVAVPFLWTMIFPEDTTVVWIVTFVACLMYIFFGHYYMVVISYYKQLREEIRQEMQVETTHNKMLVGDNMEDPMDLPPSYSDVMEKVAV